MWGFYWYSCLHLYNTVSSLFCFNGYFGNLNWRYLHIRGLCKAYEIEYPHKYGLKNGTVPSILGSWNSQWYIYICICIYAYVYIWYVYLHMCLPWFSPHQYRLAMLFSEAWERDVSAGFRSLGGRRVELGAGRRSNPPLIQGYHRILMG